MNSAVFKYIFVLHTVFIEVSWILQHHWNYTDRTTDWLIKYWILICVNFLELLPLFLWVQCSIVWSCNNDTFVFQRLWMKQLSTRESQDRVWNGVCWWWISWPWGWYQHAARCMKFQQRESPVGSLVLLCFNELRVAEYLKRCLSFMEPVGSLPCSEELYACSLL